MNVRESAQALLDYLQAEQRTIPVTAGYTDPLPAVLRALNGALQEMTALAPTFVFRTRKAARIHEPTQIVLSAPVAAGATQITVTGGADWMVGCSIRISNQEWNEVRSFDSLSGVMRLLNPMTVGGSNFTAIVFCDSIRIEPDVLRVMSPVAIADMRILTPVSGMSDIMISQYQFITDQDFGFTPSGGLERSSRNTVDEMPLFYFVDTAKEPDDMKPCEGRIRLAPMPRKAAILQYRARITPRNFTMGDIYDEGNPSADPDTDIPVPFNYVESVFLPLALQRFRGSPYMRNQDVGEEMVRQFGAAGEILRSITPQSKPGIRIIPGS